MMEGIVIDNQDEVITFTNPGNQDIAELEVLDGVGHVERVNYTADLDSIKVFVKCIKKYAKTFLVFLSPDD